MSTDPIVIVGMARTPQGTLQGSLKDVSATDLGSVAIAAAIERAQLQPADIQEVLMGCVLSAGQGQAPARQAAIKAGIPVSANCSTINKMCGSAMKTTMLAHDLLFAGTKSIMLAGGMESMTNAPYLIPKARGGYRLGHGTLYDHMMLDGLEDAYEPGKAMGCYAEDCAEKFSFSREAQDNFAITSLQRAQQAISNGNFAAEIAPVTIKTRKGDIVVDKDEQPQTAKIEKIPQLRPVFKKDGTVTPANSSTISDGAAALVMMRLSIAEQRGLKPIAKIVAHTSFAQEPAWFTTAPIAATRAVLEKANWNIDDVDLFEINEAFAVVTMAAMQELKIPHEKVNVNGGACALGHPIGATGARIIVTLLSALQQRGLQKGVASLCIGGGEATAMAFEMF